MQTKKGAQNVYSWVSQIKFHILQISNQEKLKGFMCSGTQRPDLVSDITNQILFAYGGGGGLDRTIRYRSSCE